LVVDVIYPGHWEFQETGGTVKGHASLHHCPGTSRRSLALPVGGQDGELVMI
jgi:hypothetical protein